jgi:general secretion pathway protein H
MRKQKGFTLVEILVVMLIISIITSVGVLSINRNENKQVETFASELAQLVSLAERQAMLQPNVLGLQLEKESFQFSSLQTGQAGTKQDWVPLDDNILGKREIPDGIELRVDMSHDMKTSDSDKTNDDDKKIKLPQVIISSNGDVTPFNIYVGHKGKKPLYVVSVDASGQITSKSLS